MTRFSRVAATGRTVSSRTSQFRAVPLTDRYVCNKSVALCSAMTFRGLYRNQSKKKTGPYGNIGKNEVVHHHRLAAASLSNELKSSKSTCCCPDFPVGLIQVNPSIHHHHPLPPSPPHMTYRRWLAHAKRRPIGIFPSQESVAQRAGRLERAATTHPRTMNICSRSIRRVCR